MTITITGCSLDQEIFQKEVDPYEQVAVLKENLEEDVYYVKNGTKFYAAFKTERMESKDKKQIRWLNDNERALPIYYKGEYIAITSSQNTEFETSIIRYKNLGYSIGAANFSMTENGLSCSEKDIINESDFYRVLGDSKTITIADINGTSLTENDISECGSILNLEKDEEYNIGYYIGSYYKQDIVKAETRILYEFESYPVEYKLTNNGYTTVKLPEDAKSGYYSIGDCMFIYYDFEKTSSVSANEIDMNQIYYEDLTESIFINSQQYSFVLDTDKYNMEVVCLYEFSNSKKEAISEEEELLEENNIKGYLTAPNGTTYEMVLNGEYNTLRTKLDTAIAGGWTININPKTLIISDISVTSDEILQESTEQEYRFVFDEETGNIKFFVEYEGNGEVHAIIIDPNGNTYDFEPEGKRNDNTKGILSYTMPYVATGEYIAKVYHYTDTDIKNVSYQIDTGNETDIITVTE